MRFMIGIGLQLKPNGKTIEVQATYPKAEAVGSFTVFNIKGNNYRLIVDIVYEAQRIYIKYVLTHAEYDKDKWKNDPYF
ncbi:type II toxin-antitoxin system HigB family toxin [Plectonema radiosum NIES-515]|uniref:Type II toxin-antitoxin system HigB family toxin n=1 Tax=Plectonema radiosum NIES-515 TaxID=2986073 RepID=A0ABT3AZ66_9CYAN|nr:type II toxin-antitoxin system HigB family toxin [Plectonema radiosum]MCV3214424.1 type II toxin-antitoxin system HigB family toxin [Plectonema radiosum NIES-515]